MTLLAERNLPPVLPEGLEDFSSLMENSPLGMQCVGADGVVLWANQALLGMLGYARAEYVGRPAVTFFADPEVLADIVHRLLRRETVRNQPARLRAKDGSLRHTMIDTNGFWKGGRFVHSRCFIRDKTEQMRLQEEMDENLRQLRLLTDSLPALIAYVDADQRYRFNNKTYETWLGRPSSEIQGKSIREVLGEKVYGFIRPYIERALRGEALQYETFVPHESGRRFIQVDYVPDARAGKVRGFYVLAQDVSDKKRAEETLAQKQRELQAILDSMPTMVFYKDRENRILRCNEAAARAVGKTPEEIEGQSVYDLCPEEATGYYKDDLEVFQTGRPKLGIIEQLQLPTGEKIWIQTDKFPYRNEKGEIIGIMLFAVDITERKRAMELRERGEKAQRDFVANVSHEFRTPLAAIKGFTETLLRGGIDDAKNRLKFIRTIERHADRLGALVDELLTLSSLESGTFKLSPEAIPLSPLVHQCVEGMAALAKKKEVELDVRVPGRLHVLADKTRLLQVLENLCANAIKFNKPGGWVRFSADSSGGFARLAVKDNGCGISLEDLPQVFNRFYKGANGKAANSTGLGLHIVQKIIEAHGGRIWVKSAFGKGTTFHFTLPLGK